MSADGTADDFGYDKAGLNVELTDERALNGAQRLAGYSLDVQPDGNWPGLDGAGQVRVRPAEVGDVAGWLTKKAGQIESLPKWLGQVASVSFGPSSWNEANNLRQASDLVVGAVTKFIQQTVANMNQAAATLTAVQTNYKGTETHNVDLANNVRSHLDGSAPPKVF